MSLDESSPTLNSLIQSLTIDQSKAVADVWRSATPSELDWLHGISFAAEVARKAGGLFPVPFEYWEDYLPPLGLPKKVLYFFAVLGTVEEAEAKIRERLSRLGEAEAENDAGRRHPEG